MLKIKSLLKGYFRVDIGELENFFFKYSIFF